MESNNPPRCSLNFKNAIWESRISPRLLSKSSNFYSGEHLFQKTALYLEENQKQRAPASQKCSLFGKFLHSESSALKKCSLKEEISILESTLSSGTVPIHLRPSIINSEQNLFKNILKYPLSTDTPRASIYLKKF